MIKPKYLLDECVFITAQELASGEYLESKEIVGSGANDDLVLARAKELGLLLITEDKGLVKKALFEMSSVIWQVPSQNNRYLIHSELLQSNQARKSVSKITRAILSSREIIAP